MIDFDNLPKHSKIEQIVDDLVILTGANARDYFRVLTGYYFAKVSASMRVMIEGPDLKRNVPVNCFAVTLAESGFGKGKAVGALEYEIVHGFRQRFNTDTFPVLADQHLWKLALEKAVVSGETEDKEKDRFDKFFREAGPLPFTSKKATASSIQQLRGKLLLAAAGAVNIQIDEIGLNITSMGVTEALNEFLELFDMGKTEVSMTKNTSENMRLDDIDGITPANLLVFGEPSKLFDGAAVEQAFMSLLETGYARRCLFAWGDPQESQVLTAKELMEQRIAATKASSGSTLTNHFALLADPARHDWIVTVSELVTLKKTAYEMLCNERAKEFTSVERIQRAEMKHRHWKALKLAGALAFVDESTEITEDHLLAAIGIVEESGQALYRMLARDRPYVRLGKFIAEFQGELTHADLNAMPFYPAASNSQQTMLRDARAWGYKNHVIIKNRFEDGIELFSGENLRETDLDQIQVSYSDHFAYNYEPTLAPWDQLHKMTQAPDIHWCNHHFAQEHRSDENTIPGFNMVVFDFDGGVPLETVHDLLSAYRFMTYTTKRHTPDHHRFRLLLPMNYVLALDKKDYTIFIESLSEWLPIPANLSDDASKQRSKKWLANEHGAYHYNEGELVDCLPFIPRTSRNEDHQKEMQGLQSLDNLERWFAHRIASGNRNNQMIKFALALADSGMSFAAIEGAVFAFNSKLSNGLSEDEIRATILVTVAKKIAGNP